MAYQNRVKYQISLVKTFEKAFADKSNAVKDALRKYLSDKNFKDDYGFAVISRIQERTQKENIDQDGNSFKPYSKAYKESAVFKLYAKTNQVDLTLSGNMMASMEAGSTDDAIQIRFMNELEAAKAHGNIYMHNRPFFGLPEEEELSIMRRLIIEYSRNQEQQRVSDFITFG